ncbi:hypothetical protein Dsin_022541 [Dipteronia sinensis]|uniref:TF-B3 domain-containing protein n=1 Tax=Dipteronia sinensis TaxID=43782 RepID=A0AAE0A315_9ROSI|nr:hypothetical protein Dsin_022541 [Dipteronia sinensis]
MVIFTRMQTRFDIERRLTIPRYCVGAFPAVQESQAVELKVKDEMGHVWTFRCSLQSAINPRLVFCSGWLHFASSKHLHVGDNVILSLFTGWSTRIIQLHLTKLKFEKTTIILNNILSMSEKVEANERPPYRISV